MRSQTAVRILFGLGLGLHLLGCAREPDPQPDLLLITVEGVRPDALACYGGEREVGQALCQLGLQGGRFVWAFTPSPSTGPAAAALLTGNEPAQSRVSESVASFLPSSQWTLAERLREEAGYSAAAFVGNPELNRSRNLHQGFETYRDRLSEDALVAAAQSWAERAPRPWLIWVHFPDPFTEATPGPEESAIHAPSFFGPASTPLQRLDREIGKLIGALDQIGPPPGILLAGLHGPVRTNSEATLGPPSPLNLSRLRIPMLWRTPPEPSGPGVERRITRPVSLLDVTPTLLQAAGLAPAPNQAGRALPYANSDPRAERTLKAEHAEAIAIVHGAEYAQFSLPGAAFSIADHGRLWPVGQPDAEQTPEPDRADKPSERILRLHRLARQAGLFEQPRKP